MKNENQMEEKENLDSQEVRFEDLPVNGKIKLAIKKLGFETATKVQAKTFDPCMEGRDLLVQSQTGSGKTAAFVIPLTERLLNQSQERILVLTPTRELALQIQNVWGQMIKGLGLSVLPVYGGAPMTPQIKRLKRRPEVVVGTPGRILDHLDRRTLKIEEFTTLVLDECDEMFSMGFREPIEKIINSMTARHQTLLFSATIPKEVRKLTDKILNNPFEVAVKKEHIATKDIHHSVFYLAHRKKTSTLVKLLQTEETQGAVVFCNTRSETARIATALLDAGLPAAALSGKLSQRERERVMKGVRNKRIKFLVATDVASRGIDIPEISHVINYELAENADVYIHRTGRTGRGGNKGHAISLVSPKEERSFKRYMKSNHLEVEERKLSLKKVVESDDSISDIKKEIQQPETESRSEKPSLDAFKEGSLFSKLVDSRELRRVRGKTRYTELSQEIFASENAEDILNRLLAFFFTETVQGSTERRSPAPPAERSRISFTKRNFDSRQKKRNNGNERRGSEYRGEKRSSQSDGRNHKRTSDFKDRQDRKPARFDREERSADFKGNRERKSSGFNREQRSSSFKGANKSRNGWQKKSGSPKRSNNSGSSRNNGGYNAPRKKPA